MATSCRAVPPRRRRSSRVAPTLGPGAPDAPARQPPLAQCPQKGSAQLIPVASMSTWAAAPHASLVVPQTARRVRVSPGDAALEDRAGSGESADTGPHTLLTSDSARTTRSAAALVSRANDPPLLFRCLRQVRAWPARVVRARQRILMIRSAVGGNPPLRGVPGRLAHLSVAALPGVLPRRFAACVSALPRQVLLGRLPFRLVLAGLRPSFRLLCLELRLRMRSRDRTSALRSGDLLVGESDGQMADGHGVLASVTAAKPDACCVLRPPVLTLLEVLRLPHGTTVVGTSDAAEYRTPVHSQPPVSLSVWRRTGRARGVRRFTRAPASDTARKRLRPVAEVS